MANVSKKYITIALVVFALAFVVAGILKGWFRGESKLSEEDMARLAGVRKTPIIDNNYQSIQDRFSKLWREHVSLTRDVMVSEFNNLPNLDKKVSRLMKNQEDMGNEINRYYPGSSPIVTRLLKEHISIAKDILDDIKFKRLARMC